jgi:hypothetical protein
LGWMHSCSRGVLQRWPRSACYKYMGMLAVKPFPELNGHTLYCWESTIHVCIPPRFCLFVCFGVKVTSNVVSLCWLLEGIVAMKKLVKRHVLLVLE